MAYVTATLTEYWSYPGTTSISMTTSTATQQIWQSWNHLYASSGTTSLTYNTPVTTWTAWNTAYEETAEQQAERERIEADVRAANERQREVDQRRLEEQRALRVQGEERALQLLLSLLSDEQAASYTDPDRGWFEVRGSAGGRYRIRRSGQAGNVDLMPDIGNERLLTFCCHPPGSLPHADAHVSQLLGLVTDEPGFRAVANISWQRPEPARVVETAGGPHLVAAA